MPVRSRSVSSSSAIHCSARLARLASACPPRGRSPARMRPPSRTVAGGSSASAAAMLPPPPRGSRLRGRPAGARTRFLRPADSSLTAGTCSSGPSEARPEIPGVGRSCTRPGPEPLDVGHALQHPAAGAATALPAHQHVHQRPAAPMPPRCSNGWSIQPAAAGAHRGYGSGPEPTAGCPHPCRPAAFPGQLQVAG